MPETKSTCCYCGVGCGVVIEHGPQGFWWAQTLSLVVSAALLHWEFARVHRRVMA